MPIITIPDISHPLFTTTLEVSISNINYGHHLGHDSLISLLHEARVRWLCSLGYTELNIQGVGVIIKNLVVDYLSEAFYGDKLTIKIGAGEMTRVSMELIYQVTSGQTGKEVARAITTLIFYDYQHKKVAKMPSEVLGAITR